MLLPRQIFHLAIVDCVVVAGSITNGFIEPSLAGYETLPAWTNVVCKAQLMVLVGGKWTSSLFEAHIAAGFCCVYLRHKKCLKLLASTGVFASFWIQGLVFGFFIAGLGAGSSSSDFSPCTIKRNDDTASVAMSLSVFSFSMFCYIVSAYRVYFFPNSVRSVAWQATWMFPMTYFSTYGPMLYWLCRGRWMSPAFLPFALVMESLNGFVNVVAYAVNCKYLRRSYTGRDPGRMVINMRHTGTSLSAEFQDWCGAASFRVGIIQNVQQVEIDDICEEALENSERETANLESLKPPGSDTSVSYRESYQTNGGISSPPPLDTCGMSL